MATTTTYIPNAQLVSDILGDIANRLTPGQVFDEDDLAYYMSTEFNPEDIFNNGELDAWALENGYVKAEPTHTKEGETE